MDVEMPFHSVRHPETRRWAVVEDDGVSAWLYVTEPDVPKPVGDCFVYNRQPPPPKLPDSCDRTRPPPITLKYASDSAYRPNVDQEQIRIGWNADGVAAVVLLDGKPMGFLVVGEPRGYSRGVAVEGPYGHPWDNKRFSILFEEHQSQS